MPDFNIFTFEDEDYKEVVLVNSIDDLYYLQNDIFAVLSKTKGDKFTVLVDLFLRNGFSYNRFVSLVYNGPSHCKSFLVNSRDVSETIKSRVRIYLASNVELLNNSALTKTIVAHVTAGAILPHAPS